MLKITILSGTMAGTIWIMLSIRGWRLLLSDYVGEMKVEVMQ